MPDDPTAKLETVIVQRRSAVELLSYHSARSLTPIALPDTGAELGSVDLPDPTSYVQRVERETVTVDLGGGDRLSREFERSRSGRFFPDGKVMSLQAAIRDNPLREGELRRLGAAHVIHTRLDEFVERLATDQVYETQRKAQRADIELDDTALRILDALNPNGHGSLCVPTRELRDRVGGRGMAFIQTLVELENHDYVERHPDGVNGEAGYTIREKGLMALAQRGRTISPLE